MFNKVIFRLSLFLLIFVISGCENTTRFSTYQIADICEMSPRKLEKLKNFKVEGKVFIIFPI